MSRLEEEAERWAREVRKGTTRLVLLNILRDGEAYGYQLLQGMRSNGGAQVGASEATLYPLLHELEKSGYLSSRWVTRSPGTPARKYYRLTKDGVKLLSLLRSTWKRINTEMEELVNDG